jgi:hypothetical protein
MYVYALFLGAIPVDGLLLDAHICTYINMYMCN